MYLIPNEEYEELIRMKHELADLKAMLALGDELKKSTPEEVEEEDFLSGVTCNPDAPEECESCQ